MAELMSYRSTEFGLEVLTEIHSSGEEVWEPAASLYARMHPLEVSGEVIPVPLDDALEREGWIRPDAELSAYVCAARPRDPKWVAACCLKRAGHEGPHAQRTFTWDEGF